jgi:hypothetical protein
VHWDRTVSNPILISQSINLCGTWQWIDTRIRGPTAPMHPGLKEWALCAPLLISPVRCSTSHNVIPPSAKGGIMGEKWPIKFSLQCNFHGDCRRFLHAAQLQHGTDGFTSPPKEGMLRIFLPEKSDGFIRVEPAIWGTRGQHANH